MSLSLTLATASSSAFAARVTGDANPQFRVRADGQFQWGIPSASVARITAAALPGSQQLIWRGYDAAAVQSTVTSIVELPALAAAASVLGVWLSGDTNPRVAMGTNATGDGRIGFTVGSSATSTNIWRAASNTVSTTDTFQSQLFDAVSTGDGIIRTTDQKGYYFGGTKVVGSRKTGWGIMTGTGARTAINLETATTQQIGNRLKTLIDDLQAHGLIDGS